MDFQKYIGKTIEEATKLATQAGFEVVVQTVNSPQQLDNEYRQGRIMFKVDENSIVRNAQIG
jgi:isopentenyl diphosphate isomerase/L-lactate dehydrogenase-like FMN-dependent dehydrogenase